MNVVFSNDNNVKIKLPKDNDSLTEYSHRMKKRNQHEVMFRRMVTFLINNNIIDKTKNIIDLGAWIGDNSLPWAKNVEGTVYAIDPSLENCRYIEKIAKLNDITNVRTVCTAISNDGKNLSTNESLEHCTFTRNSSCKTIVKSTTLNQLYDDRVIDNVGFIHLDVEGMELDVMMSGNNIIKESRPIIIFEQHIDRDNYVLIATLLAQLGYESFLMNEVLPGCGEDCRNILSLPYVPPYNEIIVREIEQHLMADRGGYTLAKGRPLTPILKIANR